MKIRIAIIAMLLSCCNFLEQLVPSPETKLKKLILRQQYNTGGSGLSGLRVERCENLIRQI